MQRVESRHSIARKRQRGFSIVEVVVIVAILLVVAAIAIPNLLHSSLSENESSAVTSLRTLNSACASYSMLYGGYPRSLSNLGPGNPASSGTADLIDSVLASGKKSGYVFAYAAGAAGVGGNVLSYSISANPTTPGTTGRRRFFTDQSGVIRANTAGPADAGSTPIA
jgi:type II secretory pathway pseudopilin PulG